MSFSVSGELIRKGEIEETQSFTKRVFAIKTTGDYPRVIAFELGKKNINAIDNMQTGQNVTVHFDPSSREWPAGSGKFFTNLYAWKVEADNTQPAPPTTTMASNDDDFPF